MKAPKFPKEKAVGPRGFSRWVQPAMGKYLLACCDCGLVHEMQFRITTGPVRQGSQLANVQFRARRAEGHTRRLRKTEG